MLGDRIKAARRASGITQADLSKLIGIAKSTLAGYETGYSEPDVARLQRICEALSVDANYLLQDEIASLKNTTPNAYEFDLIKRFRSLDEHGRRIVELVLKEEAARIEKYGPLPTDEDEALAARMHALAVQATGQTTCESPDRAGSA